MPSRRSLMSSQRLALLAACGSLLAASGSQAPESRSPPPPPVLVVTPVPPPPDPPPSAAPAPIDLSQPVRALRSEEPAPWLEPAGHPLDLWEISPSNSGGIS